jgi:hypothetical protein
MEADGVMSFFFKGPLFQGRYWHDLQYTKKNHKILPIINLAN